MIVSSSTDTTVRIRSFRPRLSPFSTAPKCPGGATADTAAVSIVCAIESAPRWCFCERPRSDELASGLDEQRCGPIRGVVAPPPRGLVDTGVDQRVNDPHGRGWKTRPRDIKRAAIEIESHTLSDLLSPIVNRLMADPEQFGDLFDRVRIGEPKQGLCSASLLGNEILQLSTESMAQDDRSHRVTLGFR